MIIRKRRFARRCFFPSSVPCCWPIVLSESPFLRRSAGDGLFLKVRLNRSWTSDQRRRNKSATAMTRHSSYRAVQIIVTAFLVGALSSLPKRAGGGTGATAGRVTIVCHSY